MKDKLGFTKKLKKNKKSTARRFREGNIRQFLTSSFRRIIVVFTLTIMSIVILFSIGTYQFNKRLTLQIALRQTISTATIQNLKIQNALYKVCMTTDETLRNQYQQDLSETEIAFQKNLKIIHKYDERYKKYVNEVQQLLQNALQYRNQAVLYCRQGKSNVAIILLQNNYFNSVQEVETIFENINMDMDKQFKLINKQYQIIWLSIMGILFSIIILVRVLTQKFVTRFVNVIEKAINSIVGVMEEMAEGNLDIPILYTGRNEIGKLADQLRKTKEQLRAYVDNIVMVMRALSEKNYNVTVDMTYQGNFAPIGKSLSQVIDALNTMIVGIQSMFASVRKDAQSIHQISETLIESSNKQTNSVLSLSQTIEEITMEVEENTKNAVRVKEDAQYMKESLTQCNEQMTEVTMKMMEMTDATSQIDTIILLIEAISKRTHILALNVGIEAARAESYGRGFSVLADEISKLAKQTEEAVNKTRHLINRCVESADMGNQVAKKMASAIDSLDKTVEQVLEHAKGVAIASDNQYEALQAFSEDVEKMTATIEENAKLADHIEKQGVYALQNTTQIMQQVETYWISK